MYWANFFHIYQPAEQQADILEAIVTQSYRPLLEGVKSHPKIRFTLNINGALLELFDKYNYHDLIDSLKTLGQEERIEFTGSAKYHALLPFLEEKEIVRQIEINNQTNVFYLGKAYRPKGFFPPEMAYKEELAKILESLGFEWVILDEIAYRGEPERVNYQKIYKIKNTNLLVFFRERRVSNLIMSALVRTQKSFLEAMGNELHSGRYLLTAMDGETFGHHRPGLEKSIFDVLEAPGMKLIAISEIPRHFRQVEEIAQPLKSTWASSAADIKGNIQFLSWSDPENIIHQWQREFTELAAKEVYSLDSNSPFYTEIRHKFDKALASDHFFWASAKPWWSLEMIEAGAYNLLETIRAVPDISGASLGKASGYYEKIVSTAFQWLRTGKIRIMAKEQQEIIRIPFKERTLEQKGKENVYYAFVDMMKQLEKEAAEKEEYEKAILWRDAAYKLERKWDIFDAVSAVDLVRLQIPNETVEKTIKRYEEIVRHRRSGQPEQRG